ncbi:MAG: hypothetical protein ACE5KH_04985 [Candidatus Geothermarchaeales archaeon]
MRPTPRSGLRLAALVLQVVLLLLIVLFLHGALSSLGSTLAGDDGSLSLSINPDEVTGDTVVNLSGALRNAGFLPATVSFLLEVRDFDGEVVATASATDMVQPGSASDFSLLVRVPKDKAEELFAPGVQQPYTLAFEYKSILDSAVIRFALRGGLPLEESS